MKEVPEETQSTMDIPQKPKSKSKAGWIVAIVLIVLIAIGACVAIWIMYAGKLEQNRKDTTAQVEGLNKKITDLEAELKALQEKSAAPTTTTTTLTAAETKAAIVAAMPAKKYSDLNAFMADSVNVVIAASEKQGNVTKAQAISDMAYLNSGTSPWNFNPTAANIAIWKNGSYKTYLSGASIFGVAANDYFVAFSLDSNNKISQIFMSINTTVLP